MVGCSPNQMVCKLTPKGACPKFSGSVPVGSQQNPSFGGWGFVIFDDPRNVLKSQFWGRFLEFFGDAIIGH